MRNKNECISHNVEFEVDITQTMCHLVRSVVVIPSIIFTMLKKLKDNC